MKGVTVEWKYPHIMAAQWSALFQALEIQEILNKRESFPKLPSRYPYKDSCKQTHTVKKAQV